MQTIMTKNHSTEINKMIHNHKDMSQNIESMFEKAYSFNVVDKIRAFKGLRTYMIDHHDQIRNLVKMGLIDIAIEGLRSVPMIIRYEAMSLVQNIVFDSEEFYQDIRNSKLFSLVKRYTKFEKELPNMHKSATFIMDSLKDEKLKSLKAIKRRSL
jgi:hypothetical protein